MLLFLWLLEINLLTQTELSMSATLGSGGETEGVGMDWSGLAQDLPQVYFVNKKEMSKFNGLLSIA